MGNDCPFYQAAWQVFLYATHPEKDEGQWVPRFLVSRDFSTIEETFGAKYTRNFPALKNTKFKKILSLAPKSLQRRNNQASSIGAGVTQAGTFAPVIDTNGNPLFYAIHFNDTMKDFFTHNHLLTAEDVKHAQEQPGFKDLEFPAGSIELKSAWQIVSDDSPPRRVFCHEGGGSVADNPAGRREIKNHRGSEQA